MKRLAAVALWACTSSSLAGQELGVAELARSDRATEFTSFGAIGGAAEAADGTIWVSDQRARMVVRLDSALAPISIVAARGQGAGQVELPGLIVRSPVDEMIVLDEARAALHVFNPDGQFRETIPLRVRILNPKGLAALTTGDFLVSGGARGSSAALHQFTRRGSLRRSWWPIERPARSDRLLATAALMVAGGPVLALDEGRLAYSQAAPHTVVTFDRSDTAGVVLAARDSLVPPALDSFVVPPASGSGTPSFRFGFTQSRGLVRLPGGQLLNVVTREGGGSVFELYDPMDGALLAEISAERAYRVFAVTGTGRLLAGYDVGAGPHVALLLVGRRQ